MLGLSAHLLFERLHDFFVGDGFVGFGKTPLFIVILRFTLSRSDELLRTLFEK